MDDEVIQFDTTLSQVIAHRGEILVHLVDHFLRRPSRENMLQHTAEWWPMSAASRARQKGQNLPGDILGEFTVLSSNHIQTLDFGLGSTILGDLDSGILLLLQ